MKRVIVPIAAGVEEMEAVIMIDIFRRAGWEVVAVGLNARIVSAARGVRLVPDAAWTAITPTEFDILAFPGGLKGVEALCGIGPILETARSFHSNDKLIGAICAAPLILHKAGILANRRFTSHPSVRYQLPASGWTDSAVVADGNIVTGKGAGSTFAFALALVRQAGDRDKAEE
ncbi:MAG: DJ-1 family glyoxalase III, partial [bacterium]